jgi:hypothetical protein
MRALLGDDSHSGPMVHFLAGTYAMVAVRLPGASPHLVEEAFHAHGGPGTLCLLGNGGGHVLMPGRGPSAARAAAQQVYERLGRVGWFLVDKGTADQLPARRERADTLLVVASALYDAGVYEFRDMMTEYAAATSPETATRLIHLIDPVLRRPVLRRTLATLIASRGDRSRAAERLNVHRSLLDQWLQRVEVLTGMRIESAKSFAVLASALAAHAVRTSPENAARA